MIEFIKENYLTILAGVGVIVVLFWPQIKASVLAAGTPDTAQTQSGGTWCCCPPCETEPSEKRSEMLVHQYKIRTWLEKHRLDDGSLAASDKIIAVIVASKPKTKGCHDEER